MLVGNDGVPLNRAVDLDDKMDSAFQTHPQLVFIRDGAFLLTIAALVLFAVFLSQQRRSGKLMLSRVEPVKLPAFDVLALFFVLVWLMVFPLANWFFFAAAIGGVIWLLRHHGIDPRRQWGIGLIPPLKLVGLVVWVYLAVMALMAPVSLAMDGLADYFHWDTTPQAAVDMLIKTDDLRQLAWLVFTAVFLAPAAEEILFRGFLHPVLKAQMSPRAAWGMTAAIFAAIHFDAMVFPQLFLLGLALGAVYEITGSLALCVGIHMCFNAVTAGWLLTVKWLL